MNFDLEKLRKFKETFSMLKEIDDCSKGGDKYLLFFENRMENSRWNNIHEFGWCEIFRSSCS